MQDNSDDDDFVPSSSSPPYSPSFRLPTQRKAAIREDEAVQRNFAFGGALNSQTTDTQYFEYLVDELVDEVPSDTQSPTPDPNKELNSKETPLPFPSREVLDLQLLVKKLQRDHAVLQEKYECLAYALGILEDQINRLEHPTIEVTDTRSLDDEMLDCGEIIYDENGEALEPVHAGTQTQLWEKITAGAFD